jgi:hypothetical protein
LFAIHRIKADVFCAFKSYKNNITFWWSDAIVYACVALVSIVLYATVHCI